MPVELEVAEESSADDGMLARVPLSMAVPRGLTVMFARKEIAAAAPASLLAEPRYGRRVWDGRQAGSSTTLRVDNESTPAGRQKTRF